MTATTALSCRSVVKRIDQKYLVRDVSFDLRNDETALVCGLNGAGKTSLLRLAVDFMRPDAGSIEIFGVNARLPSARQRLVFLPEKFTTSAQLTGRQVLDLHCGLRGVGFRLSNALPILEELRFDTAFLDKPTRIYSKGMVQKVGLCAALMVRADLTILDEPFSGLDPLARQDVVKCLARVRGDGRALLFTSHSLAGMSECCDTVLAIHNGEACFNGAPRELIAQHGGADLERAFIHCISKLAGSPA